VAAVGATGGVDRVAPEIHCRAGGFEEGPTGLGEAHPSAVTLEQGHGDVALQRTRVSSLIR
jgi:hypothetical protein